MLGRCIRKLGKEVNGKVEVGVTLKNIGDKSGVGSRFQTLSGILTDIVEDNVPQAQSNPQIEAPSREEVIDKDAERLQTSQNYRGTSKNKRATMKEQKKIKRLSIVTS